MYMYMHMHTYMYMCVYMYMRMCVYMYTLPKKLFSKCFDERTLCLEDS